MPMNRELRWMAAGNPVIVELQDGTCTPLPDAAADCPTTTVNADGSYEFGGVPPGDYTVVVTNPPAGANTTGGDTTKRQPWFG